MENNDYASKYRPTSFEQVLGQESTIESLSKKIETGGLPPTMLFSGPSGTGKTTLARICAKAIGCTDLGINEINAAKFTGVDDMREVTDLTAFVPLRGPRVIILDEAHRLSKNAFDSLLKFLEEPGPNTHWILCSTEPTKIPKTIRTRCEDFVLEKVPVMKIKDLLTKVTTAEKMIIESKILNHVALKSDGSPRQALKSLSTVQGMTLENAIKHLNKSGPVEEENVPVLDFCRVLVDRSSTWEAVTTALKAIDSENEAVRIAVVNYFNKVALSAKSTPQIEYTLSVLNAFAGKTFNPSDKIAPLLLAAATVKL